MSDLKNKMRKISKNDFIRALGWRSVNRIIDRTITYCLDQWKNEEQSWLSSNLSGSDKKSVCIIFFIK